MKKIKLRTAQTIFLTKANETRKKGFKKGLLIFPTGLGKSLAAFSDMNRFKVKYLVLAHNESLLKQLAKDFKSISKKKIGFMYKVQKDFNAEVTFANVQTMKKYLHKFKRNEFSYIIVDETHHARAKTYMSIINYFRPQFLLGMTATPERPDKQDILSIYDKNIIMNVTEKEAMDNGWIRPYEMVTLWDKWCDYDKIKGYYTSERFFKYNIKSIGKKYLVPERIQGIIDILKNGINKNGFKFDGIGNIRGLYFCPRVNVAKKYCEEFNKSGIKSAYLEGKTPPKQRERIFNDFETGKTQLIFNVNLIGEGIHVKGVDLVIIDRPTDSFVLWNQAKGRQIFNIEGQTYKREGLLIDLVGNSKNEFLKYTYNLQNRKTALKSNSNLQSLIQKSIGVKCNFQPEVIEHMNSKVGLILPEKEIIKLYKNGMSLKKIGEQFGCSSSPIEKLLRKNNIKTGIDFSDKDKKKIIKLYEKGMPAEKIGKQFGCSGGSILRLLRKNNIKIIYQPNKINFSDKDIQEIINLYKKGIGAEKIGKQFGCSKFTILNLLRKNNIKIIYQPNKINFSNKDTQKIINLYKKGISTEKIGKQFGCSLGRILKLLRKNNIKINRKNSIDFSDKNIQEIINLYKKGISTEKIGKQFGCVLSTILKLLKKNNIKIIIHPHKINFSNKDTQKIINLYEKGMNAEKIGKQFGCSGGSILRLLKENNIKIIIQPHKINFLNKDTQKIINLYEKGMSAKKISKQFGCSGTRIIRLLKENNIKINPNKIDFPNRDMKEIINLYEKGMSAKKISKQFGCSTSPIQKLLRKNNIKIKQQGCYSHLTTNLQIISKYKPKTIILPTKQNKKGLIRNYGRMKHEIFKTTSEKTDIREKIISKIEDGEKILLLESPELSALKEIERQNKKPSKIVIPNNKEFKQLAEALRNYKTDLKIELVNTSALQYLVDSNEEFDFIWLDYCGAFSYYIKDLDILFQKKFDRLKLILTYNIFDPAKNDDYYYFTRVIDYVLSKTEYKKIRLIKDISYKYKKQMYNLGFDIQSFT